MTLYCGGCRRRTLYRVSALMIECVIRAHRLKCHSMIERIITGAHKRYLTVIAFCSHSIPSLIRQGIQSMTIQRDRNRLRQVKIRMAVKREDIARLRKEIAELTAEANELNGRLASAQKPQKPEPEISTGTETIFSGSNIFAARNGSF